MIDINFALNCIFVLNYIISEQNQNENIQNFTNNTNEKGKENFF